MENRRGKNRGQRLQEIWKNWKVTNGEELTELATWGTFHPNEFAEEGSQLEPRHSALEGIRYHGR